MSLPSLAVVVPALNESARIADSVRRVRTLWSTADIVVADGQSEDDTAALARTAGARVVSVEQRSRGIQFRAGVDATTSEWVLFLHADSYLTDEAAGAAEKYMVQPEANMAMFQTQFDHPTMLLRFSSWWTRFDSVFTRFGDQGILIRRSYYESLGGFKPWPLFEDVDLVQRARRQRSIDVLPAKVVTSARRFQNRGPLRQQLSNGWLLLRYLVGADPHRLARQYPASNTEPK